MNTIYTGISWIVKIWYLGFSHIFGTHSALPWILAIAGTVLTVRIILFSGFRATLTQQYLARKHAKEFEAVRNKFRKDAAKRAKAEQELRKNLGMRPFAGVLPSLMQALALWGLYAVLRGFNAMSGSNFDLFGQGSSNISAHAARMASNYAFNPEQVRSFLDARLFGVPLGAYITQPVEQLRVFLAMPGDSINFSRMHIALVLLPLMILATVAVFVRITVALRHQPAQETKLKSIHISAKTMHYFLLGGATITVFLSGVFQPGCLLIYILTDNCITLWQTHRVYTQLRGREAVPASEKVLT